MQELAEPSCLGHFMWEQRALPIPLTPGGVAGLSYQLGTHYFPKSLERIKPCLAHRLLAKQGKDATHFQEFCQNCLKQSKLRSQCWKNVFTSSHCLVYKYYDISFKPKLRQTRHFFLSVCGTGPPPRINFKNRH